MRFASELNLGSFFPRGVLGTAQRAHYESTDLKERKHKKGAVLAGPAGHYNDQPD